jgi:hypothetical protein
MAVSRTDIVSGSPISNDELPARIELVLAPDIAPQEVADIIGAQNQLHVAITGHELSDPIIMIGLPDEVRAPELAAR